MPKRNQYGYRAHQHVACRYAGNNGDLIVGRIKSVRNAEGGKILLENLLTGKDSVKSIDVLAKRNVVIGKRQAEAIVRVAGSLGLEAARNAAVKAAASALAKIQPELPRLEPVDTTNRIVEEYRALSQEDQAKVARELWGSVLELFGVGP